jgi:hypothetical protein
MGLVAFLNDHKDAAPWAAVFVTLLALIASPVIQAWIMRRQERARVVAANRVRWIEDFRKDIASFCELAHHYAYLQGEMSKQEKLRNKEKYESHRSELTERSILLNTIYFHLVMRCNPDRRATKDIADLLEDIINLEIEPGNSNLDTYDKYFEAHGKLTKKLMQTVREFLSWEWKEKVEKLK